MKLCKRCKQCKRTIPDFMAELFKDLMQLIQRDTKVCIQRKNNIFVCRMWRLSYRLIYDVQFTPFPVSSSHLTLNLSLSLCLTSLSLSLSHLSLSLSHLFLSYSLVIFLPLASLLLFAGQCRCFDKFIAKVFKNSQRSTSTVNIHVIASRIRLVLLSM